MDYVINTDLPPEAINRIGMAIFKAWLDFALGQRSLGGHRLAHPTGRYAASVQFRQLGVAEVAIVADESIAPEAAILETGHSPIDLKIKLQRGRAYPMHRARGAKGPSMRASLWGTARGAAFSGFAMIGPNSPADSWIIPQMPGYAPARVLSEMARQMAGELKS